MKHEPELERGRPAKLSPTEKHTNRIIAQKKYRANLKIKKIRKSMLNEEETIITEEITEPMPTDTIIFQETEEITDTIPTDTITTQELNQNITEPITTQETNLNITPSTTTQEITEPFTTNIIITQNPSTTNDTFSKINIIDNEILHALKNSYITKDIIFKMNGIIIVIPFNQRDKLTIQGGKIIIAMNDDNIVEHQISNDDIKK